jgi:hypothetical protein
MKVATGPWRVDVVEERFLPIAMQIEKRRCERPCAADVEHWIYDEQLPFAKSEEAMLETMCRLYRAMDLSQLEVTGQRGCGRLEELAADGGFLER